MILQNIPGKTLCRTSMQLLLKISANEVSREKKHRQVFLKSPALIKWVLDCTFQDFFFRKNVLFRIGNEKRYKKQLFIKFTIRTVANLS